MMISTIFKTFLICTKHHTGSHSVKVARIQTYQKIPNLKAQQYQAPGGTHSVGKIAAVVSHF